jgi:hypothetical protein
MSITKRFDMHAYIWCSAGHVEMRDMGFLRRGCEVYGFDAFINHNTSNSRFAFQMSSSCSLLFSQSFTIVALEV